SPLRPAACAWAYRSLRLAFCRTSPLLRSNGPNACDVAAGLPHARRVLQLSRRSLKAQIEPLFFQLEELIVELIDSHCTQIVRLHRAPLFRDSLAGAGLFGLSGR